MDSSVSGETTSESDFVSHDDGCNRLGSLQAFAPGLPHSRIKCDPEKFLANGADESLNEGM